MTITPPPEIANSARLSAAFAGSYGTSASTITATPFDPTSNDVITGTPLKVWTINGMLHVSGLTEGSVWNVYNLYGQLIYTGIAAGDKAEIALPGRGIYIIQSGNQTIKAVY
jgi:hypothetical protein